ncbi:hypothetical protein ANAEL_02548 [Anaerolineales bacterium]|nr:hypothetical protein ANAEL_02548 [Anaerolineales bacterium]
MLIPNMKIIWTIVSATIMLCLFSCKPLAQSPIETSKSEIISTPTADAKQPPLKTIMGDFVIASVRLTDEVHGEKSQAGEKFLLVILTQPDLTNLAPGKFSLEEFGNMVHNSDGEIYILGSDNSKIISTMAGWVEDEFAMGFRVPILETYTLYWPGNLPIDLNINK